MTNDPTQLDTSTNYTGTNQVLVGNGASLPVTHSGSIKPTPYISLHDVFVQPHITKNLTSISKLIAEIHCSIKFFHFCFIIQDLCTGMELGTSKCIDGLYVLDLGHKALLASLKNNKLSASFSTWHARLGHVSNRVLENLNKNGDLSFTYTLPSPIVCSSCQLGKSHKLPFLVNDHRGSSIINLIHCDLWGPSPILYSSSFRFYVIFIDDRYIFTWFYP